MNLKQSDFSSNGKSFDSRGTLSRATARSVYDDFAKVDHTGGKDVSSGYGGPAIRALLTMASFYAHPSSSPLNVLDYGCGQGKLAELVMSNASTAIQWIGIDQSPLMVQAAKDRLKPYREQVSINLLEGGNPNDVRKRIQPHSVDRFVSTYCLDLLSEKDMYTVLDLAEYALKPNDGLILLAGITWGYKDSMRTCLMTILWNILYVVARKKVGGCRPQHLEPYLLSKGWTIVDKKRTMPTGFPWMVSEVIAARPPVTTTKK